MWGVKVLSGVIWVEAQNRLRCKVLMVHSRALFFTYVQNSSIMVEGTVWLEYINIAH
jgi:hypothetical protein